MKKFLKYIPITLFIALLIRGQMLHAENNSSNEESKNVTAIEDMIKKSKNKKKEFTAQNLYLEIYETVNLEPKKTSIKKTSSKFSMTEDQMQKLINEGDLSVLSEREKDLTIDKLSNQYFEIFNTYQREFELETMRTDLEQEVKPSEIYADGDTSNSDFDLIHDLSIIEKILFGKASQTDFGGEFPKFDIEFVSKAQKEAIEDLFTTPEEQEKYSESLARSEATEEAREGINPLLCLETESVLAEAINSFEEKAQTEEGIEDLDDVGDYGDLDENLETLNDAEIPSAKTDEWPTKYLCPDESFFCISIKFDVGPPESFPKTSNAVASHVHHINEDFDKMLEKPLSPNKLTGNLFEVPKCKSGFANIPLNMNIITMAVPGPKQANEDLYHNADIEKEWKKIKDAFGFFSYEKTEAKEEESLGKEDPSVEDRSVRKSVSNAPPNPTINEVVDRSREINESLRSEKAEEIRKKPQDNASENQNRYFQVIYDELNTMNMYFDAMKEKFEEMKTPCNDFSTKRNCT